MLQSQLVIVGGLVKWPPSDRAAALKAPGGALLSTYLVWRGHNQLIAGRVKMEIAKDAVRVQLNILKLHAVGGVV